jgi:hypothetical protein
MKLKQISYHAIFTVILLTGFLPNSAQAYEIFWNREAWQEEIQDSPVVREDFSIPNQFLSPLPFVLPSGFTADEIDAFGGSVVRQEELRTGLASPASLEAFSFPEPVEAFGFEFETPPLTPGVNGPKIFTIIGPFGEITLNDTGTVDNTGFLGIVAIEDNPPIESFQTLGIGNIGTLNIDDLDFTPTNIPEPCSLIASLLVNLNMLRKRRIISNPVR